MFRTAAVLHLMAPQGTEMLLEYLRLDRLFWGWEHIFEPMSAFTDGEDRELKFLEPRVDFFTRHPGQFAAEE